MSTEVSGSRHCPKCGMTTNEALCPTDGLTTIVRASLDPSESLVKPGDMVAGRYRIKELIGRGGFGAVCSAEHTGTGQAVALKYLALDPGSSDDDGVKRFFQEARITSSLRHANTVRVFDFGQAENGALYMAMELLHGPNLEKVLRDLNTQGQVMTEAQAIDLAIPVLRALGEAHAAELVHRDLKPANIMIAEVPNDDPIVKVLDFGIARAKDSQLTGGGKALGTPAYMSPEQCRGGRLDGRSDLYSLGVILYRCVAGHTPFVDENPLSLMFKHASAEVPDLHESARTHVSEGFIDIVHRALAKKPEQRFDDARAMRIALEALRGGAMPALTAGYVVEGTDSTEAPTTANSSLVDSMDAPTTASAALPGSSQDAITRGYPAGALGGPAGLQGAPLATGSAARPRTGLWVGLGVGLAGAAAAIALLAGRGEDMAPVAPPVAAPAALAAPPPVAPSAPPPAAAPPPAPAVAVPTVPEPAAAAAPAAAVVAPATPPAAPAVEAAAAAGPGAGKLPARPKAPRAVSKPKATKAAPADFLPPP